MDDFLWLIMQIHDYFTTNQQNSWFFTCQNMNFSHGWYFLNACFHKYTISQKNRQNSRQLLSKYELFSGLIFFKWGFSYINALLFYWKSTKFTIFATVFRNINFLRTWLLNMRFFFFFFNELFRRKSAKSLFNCRNVNFPSGWYF